MGAFLDYASQFKRKENAALSEFAKGLKRQIDYTEKNVYNRRSWIKRDESGMWVVQLGKLEGQYEFDSSAEALEFLKRTDREMNGDPDFLKLTDVAYGDGTVEEPVKAVRKQRAVRLD